MLIGNQYADNKLYRGIKHYDHLPLSSGDIHEYEDTSHMKNAYLMNNIIGHGVLNSPNIILSSQGIKVSEPIVLLLDGDIVLIQSDTDKNITNLEEIVALDTQKGVVCVVGWYQSIDSSSTMRSYGGVRNAPLENDLIHPTLNMQLSTRYQFRWDLVLIREAMLSSDTLTFNLPIRDRNGDLQSGEYPISTSDKRGNTFIAAKPTAMNYAVSDLYIIPIIDYIYSNNQIENATIEESISPRGAATKFINSSIEPAGKYTDGTTWYNPDTREFKRYVNGDGWVSDKQATMGLIQVNSNYVSTINVPDAQNITIPTGISGLQEGDMLQVSYEGLLLAEDTHYTINYNTNTVTLLNFTMQEGDTVSFHMVRVVEVNDVTNVSRQFIQHMNSKASDLESSHVKLSDTMSDSDALRGVAATPKMVQDLSNSNQSKFEEIDTELGKILPIVVLKGITLSPESYVDLQDSSLYPFRSYHADSRITADMVPSVTYSLSDALSGIHSPVSITGNGYIYFYASEPPESYVHIESIVLHGGEPV